MEINEVCVKCSGLTTSKVQEKDLNANAQIL